MGTVELIAMVPDRGPTGDNSRPLAAGAVQFHAHDQFRNATISKFSITCFVILRMQELGSRPAAPPRTMGTKFSTVRTRRSRALVVSIR